MRMMAILVLQIVWDKMKIRGERNRIMAGVALATNRLLITGEIYVALIEKCCYCRATDQEEGWQPFPSILCIQHNMR